jgi:hypothetical protein
LKKATRKSRIGFFPFGNSFQGEELSSVVDVAAAATTPRTNFNLYLFL